jgi:hypothetical integral membrane protein (TIGR02206 family)
MLDYTNNFFKNFFGQGEENYNFTYFSLPHILPIFIMILIIFIIYKYRKQIRENHEFDLKLRLWISFIISTVNMSLYWLYVYIDADITISLPISVCQTVMIFSPFLLLTKNQKLFDIFYFWTLSGSTNALITPAILDNYGPTKYRYYQFWIGHTGIFIVIFYCIFVLQMKVTFKSMIRSITWLSIFSLLGIYANSSIKGANYLFLSGSEAGTSILDLLPTYLPARVIILFILVSILFTIAYLPWYLMSKKERYKESIDNISLKGVVTKTQ